MRPSASFLKMELRKFQTVEREGIPKRNGKTERVTCGSCHGCALSYHNVSLTSHPTQCLYHLITPMPLSPRTHSVSHLIPHQMPLLPHSSTNVSLTSYPTKCLYHFIPHPMTLLPHTPPYASLIDLYLNLVCSYLKGIYKFH